MALWSDSNAGRLGLPRTLAIAAYTAPIARALDTGAVAGTLNAMTLLALLVLRLLTVKFFTSVVAMPSCSATVAAPAQT